MKQNSDTNKGIDIVRSTYYQSKFPDTKGADFPVSREAYFKGHVVDNMSVDEAQSAEAVTPNRLGNLKYSREMQMQIPLTQQKGSKERPEHMEINRKERFVLQQPNISLLVHKPKRVSNTVLRLGVN